MLLLIFVNEVSPQHFAIHGFGNLGEKHSQHGCVPKLDGWK